MALMHYWPIYVGAAALALPVAVHFLTRPRPTKMPIATLRFVREAIQQRRSQHRLRDFLILALRMLAIACFAWALARPLIGERPLVTTSEDTTAIRVVLLDVSQSMGAGQHGITAFEKARSKAASYLNYRTGLKADLIQGGAAARTVFGEASTNFSALREELNRSTARPERLNVQAALQTAAKILSAGNGEGENAGPRRELVIVSDFQRSSWAAADFSVLPVDTVIELESVVSTETRNLAIVSARCRGRSSAGRETVLEVEVGNYSPAAEQVQVEVLLGDKAYRLEGICPANQRVTLTQTLALPASGWTPGMARLLDIDDALRADNVRPFVAEVRNRPTYALITRQSDQARSGSSFYLERALAPVAARNEADRPPILRLDPAQWDPEVLSGADLIVLDHPGKLPPEAIQLLANLMRHGRAILYVAAEVTDATNLKLLAEAAGAELQLPVDFAPPLVGQVRRDLFLAEFRRDQAPFTVFGDDVNQVTASLRFAGGLTSRQREDALPDDIVASYSDRSAALVVTPSGAGTLAILNADLSSSSIIASQAFVPLIGELVERLLNTDQRKSATWSGEPFGIYLPSSVTTTEGLQITGGSEGERVGLVGDLVEESLGVMWRSPAAPAPAVYQVKREDESLFALATELPAEESDLKTLDASVFTSRLSGGRAIHFRSGVAGEEARDDVWTWFAVACVMMMLLELGVLRYFRT